MVRLRFKLSHDLVHSFKLEYTYTIVQLNKQEAHGGPQTLTDCIALEALLFSLVLQGTWSIIVDLINQ